ncbi:hypothetical protein D9M68_491890 [compost metagenome]
MRQHRARQVEHGKDVGAEGGLDLAFPDVFQRLPGMLLGRVVDQDIELAVLLHRLARHPFGVAAVGKVACDRKAFAPRRFDQFDGFASVGMLVEIGNGNVGALAREGHGNGAANTAVAARDQRHAPLQAAAADVVIRAAVRLRPHGCFQSRLAILMLGRDALRCGHGDSCLWRGARGPMRVRRKFHAAGMHPAPTRHLGAAVRRVHGGGVAGARNPYIARQSLQRCSARSGAAARQRRGTDFAALR